MGVHPRPAAALLGTLRVRGKPFEHRHEPVRDAVAHQWTQHPGQPKTHLRHILSAVAINLLRINTWLNGTLLASTRQSSFARLMAQAA